MHPVHAHLPFPVFLKFSFFSVSRRRSRRFSADFPRVYAGEHHLRFVYETVSTRRGLLRCDIIENKIRTHLLLGQSYPCCQSRCHTHTTLTSTPKSDIVCWNRPSLWLFSRAERLLLDRAACRWWGFQPQADGASEICDTQTRIQHRPPLSERSPQTSTCHESQGNTLVFLSI